MDKSDSPIYWRIGYSDGKSYSHEITSKLNRWLVELFGEILTKLEMNEINRRDNSKNQYINDSIALINGVVVCFEMDSDVRKSIC
jgi:hypothetical protein